MGFLKTRGVKRMIPKSMLKKWLRPEVEKAVWGNA
jgi:hypothetical protein